MLGKLRERVGRNTGIKPPTSEFAQLANRRPLVRFLPAHEVTTLAQPLPHFGPPPFLDVEQPLSARPVSPSSPAAAPPKAGTRDPQ